MNLPNSIPDPSIPQTFNNYKDFTKIVKNNCMPSLHLSSDNKNEWIWQPIDQTKTKIVGEIYTSQRSCPCVKITVYLVDKLSNKILMAYVSNTSWYIDVQIFYYLNDVMCRTDYCENILVDHSSELDSHFDTCTHSQLLINDDCYML